MCVFNGYFILFRAEGAEGQVRLTNLFNVGQTYLSLWRPRDFKNGVAEVSWQLNPDGMYYMDEDGFGMTDDEEVEIYGFINRQGKVLVKFQNINKDWGRLKSMRKEAERKIKADNC